MYSKTRRAAILRGQHELCEAYGKHLMNIIKIKRKVYEDARKAERCLLARTQANANIPEAKLLLHSPSNH